MDSSGLTSSSRFKPFRCQLEYPAKHQRWDEADRERDDNAARRQSGAPNVGNNVPATWTISHAPTKYSPAMRTTLRRFSSAKKEGFSLIMDPRAPSL